MLSGDSTRDGPSPCTDPADASPIAATSPTQPSVTTTAATVHVCRLITAHYTRGMDAGAAGDPVTRLPCLVSDQRKHASRSGSRASQGQLNYHVSARTPHPPGPSIPGWKIESDRAAAIPVRASPFPLLKLHPPSSELLTFKGGSVTASSYFRADNRRETLFQRARSCVLRQSLAAGLVINSGTNTRDLDFFNKIPKCPKFGFRESGSSNPQFNVWIRTMLEKHHAPYLEPRFRFAPIQILETLKLGILRLHRD